MAGWFGPIQVLLAQQADRVAAAEPGGLSKEALLSVVLFVGAMISLLANPVWGAFSDRTRSRLGRRVPWVIGGVLIGAVGLLLLSVAASAVTMVLAWSLVQLALNAAWAGGTAAVPDQVPVARRGLIGGMIAIAGTVGVLLGIKIAELTGSIAQGYVVIAVVMLALSVPYLLGSRDIALPADHELAPMDWKSLLRSFWISPKEHPDFAWAWITRFMVNLGNWIALELPLLLPHRRPRLHRRRGDCEARRAGADLRRHDRRDHGGRRPLERPHRSAQGVRDLVRRARSAPAC